MLKRWTHLLAPLRLAHPEGQPAHVATHVSAGHLAAATRSIAELLVEQQTAAEGLTDEVAADRLVQVGRNVLESEPRFRQARLFLAAVSNPLVLLLLGLSGVSYFQHDRATASIMLVIALLGVGLRFLQESRANQVLDRLQRLVHTTATVIRSGARREIATAELVPGDLVEVAVGDLFPADLRLVASHDLFVSQSTLTGESLPVEKSSDPVEPGTRPPLEFPNLCFLGTSVESGTGRGVVIATGANTCLGSLAEAVRQPVPPSSFDRGISQFTWLMLRFVALLVPTVFVLNGWTHGNWHEALLFALAVAVGLTPEMLPMIVTVCLSRGAVELSRRRLVVKRLNAIQNLGALDVLCTDKTGTLTADRILLERHCDVHGRDSEPVLALAYLNSHFQTGLRSVMDRCVLEHSHLHTRLRIPECEQVDEIPFDFTRRVMSVVVRLPDGTHRLICKGAPEAIFARCSTWADGEPESARAPALPAALAGPANHDSPATAAPLVTSLPVTSPLPHTVTTAVQEAYRALSADGFRVLA
ncbi:MAG: HAD-IC family P-type ATPase, partial [Planctomycetaceae bacterium]